MRVVGILLTSEQETDRRGALAALRSLIEAYRTGDWHWSDAATPELLERLPCLLDDAELRWTAWNAVEEMGDAAVTDSILDHLERLFCDPDKSVTQSAARIASSLGTKAATPKILEGLADMLASPDEQTREYALYPFLGGICASGAPQSFFDRLAHLLGADDERVRWAAVRPASKLAGDDADAAYLCWLGRLLVDASSKVRESAASVVEFAGRAVAKPEILRPLGRLLEDPDDRVRRSATKAVGRLGTASFGLLDRLVRRFMDRDSQVREAAAWSVHHLGDVAATPEVLLHLSIGLTDGDSSVQTAALYAVKELGGLAATPRILASLARILVDPNQEMRRKAVEAVEMMGDGAATIPFADTMIKAYQDRESRNDEIGEVVILLMRYGLRCRRVSTEEGRRRSLFWWKRPKDATRARTVWVSINEPSPRENPSHAGS